MKEIESFETDLESTRELGYELVATDNKLMGLIESQLSGLDDSYQTLQAGAQTTHV